MSSRPSAIRQLATNQPTGPRRREAALIVIALVGILLGAGLAACSGVGSAGLVPTPAPTPVASGIGASNEPMPPPDAGSPSPLATPGPSSRPTVPGPAPTKVPTLPPTPDPSVEPTPRPSTLPSQSAAPGTTPAPTGTTTVRAYLLMPSRGGGDPLLVPVLRTVPATKAVATAAVTELLGGPASNERGLSSVIPDGTTLLGISINGSTATVDLTGTFGTGGGTFSMLGRLAQLVFTVTQFANVDTVLLRMDGTPVSVLGGEGIQIGSGLTRADFHGQLPSIFVDRPAWQGALASGSRVTGLANVFEAQFLLRLVDGGGHVLIDTPVMATCGTGCWGTFDVAVNYQVAKAQWGTLRVYDRSAKDGSVQDARDYPVWLTP